MFLGSSQQLALRAACILCVFGYGAASFFLPVSAVHAQATAPLLWERNMSAPSPKRLPEVLRSMPIAIEPLRLRNSTNPRWSLSLPDGQVVTVVVTRSVRTETGVVWQGTIEDQPMSEVGISIVNEAMAGSIQTARGQSFRVRKDSEAGYVVEEVDLGKLPPEGTPTQGQEQGKSPTLAECPADRPGEVDVLVVYTKAAREDSGGADNMKARIDLAIDQANKAYQKSVIGLQLRLVHATEISYAETGQTGPACPPQTLECSPPVHPNDRDQLKNKTDGQADEVHQWRYDFGADVVVMITKEGSHCGYTYPMYSATVNFAEDSAFAVVLQSCLIAPGLYSFVHEIGHLLGAAHDWDAWVGEGETSMFAQNHGHIQPTPTTGINPWRTIMALGEFCPECKRILRYSNPDVSFEGDATGVNDGDKPENNSWVINSVVQKVANFRCSKK